MADKRAKFVELANKRVNATIKKIQLIGNLSAKSSYEFTSDDVEKIHAALLAEVDAAMSRFDGNVEKDAFSIS
jgi:hypothetical protein